MPDEKPLIHVFGADMQEIMGWPNTPGARRYHAAAAGLVEMRDFGGKPRLFPGPETEITKSISDIRRYEERVENLDYQKWAVAEFNERMSLGSPDKKGSDSPDKKENVRPNPLKVIAHIAEKGNNRESIGLALVCKNPEDQLARRGPIDPRHHEQKSPHFAFTRLPRSQDWMGLDPALKMMKGLRAIIFGNQLPHYVIAMTDEIWGWTPPANSFPLGQALTLKEILEWHGARPIWTDEWDIIR